MKYSTSVHNPTAIEQRLFKKVPKPLSFDNLFVETYHSTQIDWNVLTRAHVVQTRAASQHDPVVTKLAPAYPPLTGKFEKAVNVGTFFHCGTEWTIRATISYNMGSPKSFGLHILANKDIIPGKFITTVGFCLWNPETRKKRTDFKREKLGSIGWSFPKFYPLNGFEIPLVLQSHGVSNLGVYIRFDLMANSLYPLVQPSRESLQKLGLGEVVVEWNTKNDSYVTCPAFEFAGGLFRLLYSYSPPMLMLQRLPGGSASIRLGISVLSRKVYSFEHEFPPGFNDYGIIGTSLGRRNNFTLRLHNCIAEEPPMFRAVISNRSEALPNYGEH